MMTFLSFNYNLPVWPSNPHINHRIGEIVLGIFYIR